MDETQIRHSDMSDSEIEEIAQSVAIELYVMR